MFRIAGSFAIVFTAYWTYALVAVPLIEPAAERPDHQPLTKEEREQWAEASRGRWREDLEGLFAPDAWELDNPTILEGKQVKLLLRKYSRLGDGKRLEIRPCTMVFMPDGPAADRAERRRRSIILEAPEGAVLEFDQAIDLSHGQFGRLSAGRLNGRITIRGEGRSPGPDDDLLIVTRDMELNEQRIRTPNAVDFRLGPNHGRGRHLWIKLLADAEGGRDRRHGPNIEGIELIEIQRLEQLHLVAGGRGILPGGESPRPDRPGSATSPKRAGPPIEVTCRGPFRFDPIGQVATFEDQVDVLQAYPNGPSDQLNCELLLIYFGRPRGKPGSKQASQWKLEPRRIEANGHPVSVRAPSRNLDVRAERLEFDLQTGLIVLDGDEEVYLHHDGNEMHAPSIRYQSAESGRLGQVLATGPGWLRGALDDTPGQALEARWNGSLQVQPDADEKVVSLVGGAVVSFSAIGRISAEEVHLWLSETQRDHSKGRSDLEPDRMRARGNVDIQSLQVTGAVEELGLWFEKPQKHENPDTPRGEHASSRESDRAAGRSRSSGSSATTFLAKAGQFQGRHFRVDARTLQARVVRDDRPKLAELTLEGNVRLTETRTARPDESPVSVSGELIHVLNASEPFAAITVSGAPGQWAQFDGRGLGLAGSRIKLHRGTNELAIEGPGRMDLPLDRDFEGRPLDPPGQVHVHWQGRMALADRTVRFEDTVVAESEHPQMKMQMRTDDMDVIFLQPIRFDQSKNRPDPQIERITMRGGVRLENRSFEESELTSSDQMRVLDVAINLIDGKTTAKGPGWMRTIRSGLPDMIQTQSRGPAPRPPDDPTTHDDPTAHDDPNPLTYLDVTFEGPLTANLHHRNITFHDEVRAIHGSVTSWDTTLDPDRPEGLGPKGVLLDCEQMNVVQMRLPKGSGRALEFEAQGNVRVEGSHFTARAPRLSYAQAKDLLILEGNGRSDAEIYQQKHVGGPLDKTSARRIFYWRTAGTFHFDGPRSFEMNLNPSNDR